MLQLRPICEHCGKPLPPDSTEAMICSYECTFCKDCYDSLLHNVCPNCGGGLVPRPIRPRHNWKDNNTLGADPATTDRKHHPIDLAAFAPFRDKVSQVPPEKR
jgi:hypothetical protein